MASAGLPVSLPVHTTIGAVFVGFSLACGIFGILVAQVFNYFRHYPGDTTLFKGLVLLLVLLETTDQFLIGHIVYFYSIENYANPRVLAAATTTWSFILQLTFGAVVGAIVKSYFALRVWRFSDRNIWITGLIFLLTFGQLGLAMAFTAKAFMLPSVFAVHQLQTLGTIALSVGVLTDFITAGALCYFLSQLRTGLKASDNLVNSLCRYAINTGMLTSTVSLATVILYNVMPVHNLYFIATYFVLSKLYAISFMATLNTRRAVRGRGTDQQGNTTNNTNLFHLGTRMPSLGPSDLEHWDKVDPPFVVQQRMQEFQPGNYYDGSGRIKVGMVV